MDTTAQGRATLATVAASAGVSVATVSKVLNGRSDVSAATRARVQELLRQYDYVGRRPEPVNRGFVELVFQDAMTAYSVEVIEGVLAAAREAGVSVVVSNRGPGHAPNGASAERWARGLSQGGRQGVIAVTNELSHAQVAALTRERLPVVVIDPLNMAQASMVSVGSTNFAGGLAAAQHLLALGHRRIAFLGGPAGAGCNRARQQGYRGALEAAGVEVPTAYVRNASDFAYAPGVLVGGELLDLPERPTAVFAGNDELAVGVVEAARVRGLRVPEQLSVVGFDDTSVAKMAAPPLTTVRQPLREMGAVALRTTLRLAAGERVDSHHVELATELVVRRSTAPAG